MVRTKYGTQYLQCTSETEIIQRCTTKTLTEYAKIGRKSNITFVTGGSCSDSLRGRCPIRFVTLAELEQWSPSDPGINVQSVLLFWFKFILKQERKGNKKNK